MKKIILLNAILIYSVYFSNAQNIQKPSINKCGGQYPDSTFKSAISIVDICNEIESSSVQSFNIFYQKKLGDSEAIKNIGPIFSEATKKVINKGRPGDIYYFEKIIIMMPDNSLKRYPDFTLKIK